MYNSRFNAICKCENVQKAENIFGKTVGKRNCFHLLFRECAAKEEKDSQQVTYPNALRIAHSVRKLYSDVGWYQINERSSDNVNKLKLV